MVKPISEIARELSLVFKDAREDAWVQVAERAQSLFVSKPSLLEHTQAELAAVAEQIRTLQAINSLEFSCQLTKSQLDNCGLRAISLVARLHALQTWTPEKARNADLPWIGTKVFVDRGRLRDGGTSGIYEVWALRQPAPNDVSFRSEVPAFTVWAPGSSPFTLESQPLTAKDFGSWWKYPVVASEGS